jgi:hypothetical protein
MKHEEFPELTPKAKAAWNAACIAGNLSLSGYGHMSTRRFFAAFLREAMKQARRGYGETLWDELNAIADNLHSPPPPPTLAEAREADLDTPAGRDVVRDFLATLGEGLQP